MQRGGESHSIGENTNSNKKVKLRFTFFFFFLRIAKINILCVVHQCAILNEASIQCVCVSVCLSVCLSVCVHQEYLESIHQLYEDWLINRTSSPLPAPVLVIDHHIFHWFM